MCNGRFELFIPLSLKLANFRGTILEKMCGKYIINNIHALPSTITTPQIIIKRFQDILTLQQ